MAGAAAACGCGQPNIVYSSDLSDEEFALVALHIPPSGEGGRPRSVDIHLVLNAIFYLLATGCQWRMLPKHFPPRSTVYEYFSRWRKDGTLDRIQHLLLMAARGQAGREASPSGAIIDSQSLATAERGALGAMMRPSG